ncbi:MAG: DUF1801 domain-containing protein [Dermatophilus congolensis]|nr:DUF1801 domain-containing protein [Dermatophilus congolensis]
MSVIDDYLAEHDGEHLRLMNELRALIEARVPEETTEALSWGMPTYKLNGNLVHFAAGKHHVGFYPGADGVALVAEEADALGLKRSKGAIQLPLDRPLPVDLLTRVLDMRVEQQRAKKR